MKPLLTATILTSVLVQSVTAIAQEDLSTILDRGTPAIWYVCGPFESDLPNGILDAVTANQQPLGRFDFFSSQGGTSRFQPSHGLEIKTPSGKATWLRIRADEPTVDLSPFFAERDSGIAFAAFFAESPVPTQVLLELQTILGVRVFLNGDELKNITGGPIGFTGVEYIVANFRAGENLLLLEIPGIHLESLAEAYNIPPALFPNALLKNRSLLTPKTGFEFILRLQEVKPFENIVYATQLVNTGIFSGSGDNVFQDVWLTLFNPSEEPSASLEYSGMAVGASARFQKIIPPIPPRERHLERISIPIAAAIPGQPISVQSSLSHNLESARWQSSVVTAIHPKAADLFFVPLPDDSEQRQASRNSDLVHSQKSIQDKIKLAKENEDYGFSLGPAENWFPVLINDPELRQDLARFRDIRSITAWNTHSRIDHRIVNGETLIRNLQYGTALSNAWLSLPQSSYWSWNAPAIAPQLPQILSDSRVPGLIHNVDAFGLPSLYYQLGLDGSTLLHRKKANTPALRSLLDVHHSSAAQHRFWQLEHIDTDLLVYENHANAPEPFWTENILPLPEAIPSITVTGTGADRYFASLLQNRMFLDRSTPLESRPIQEVNAFGLLSNPELTDRLATIQQNLLIAETMTTLATRVGAAFPYDAMDHAWRSLLSLSTAGKLSGLIPSERKTDYLALMRTLDATIGSVTRDALTQLAGKIHTQTDLSNEQGAQQALIVFNPTNWTRSDLVESVILPTEGRGLTLLDDTGRVVPFEVLDYTIANNLLRRAVIRFVATDVPSLGHKTYFFINAGGLPQESTVFTPFIENDFYRIEFNNGDIASIQSKRNAELNFSDHHFNELVAYHTVSTGDGPEWNGDITRSSEQTSTVTMERTPLGHRATITTPFLGGTLERTVTLHYGIPRIDFDIQLEGVSRSHYLFAAEFSPTSKQLIAILGQAFGRVQGPRDRPAPLFDSNTTTQQLPAPNVSQRLPTSPNAFTRSPAVLESRWGTTSSFLWLQP
ncbi:MAG: glycoside hydrolase family 38 C-terminal domain-containing protein [Candidatus Hydrogenedentota bacterium]